MTVLGLGLLLELAFGSPAPPTADAEPSLAEEYNLPPPEIEACDERLAALGVTFAPSRLPVHESPGGFLCGAEQVVRYDAGPGAIRHSSRPRLTCQMALAMPDFERVVQEEAKRHLGRSVAKIRHRGTYNCREIVAYPGWVSQHSFANALDVAAFELRGGKTISVAEHYGDEWDPRPGPESAFLRAVALRLYDEDVFQTVLTPRFDRAHWDHLHLDMAPFRTDGVR
jgi:hypothetical protein